MSQDLPSDLHIPDPLAGRDSLVTVIHYTAVVGVAAHLLFVPLFLWLNVWQMAAVNLLSAAILAFCFWLNRHGHPHAALLIGAIEVVTIAALAVLFVGWSSGFHYYILLLTPLIFYSPKWRAAYKIALVAILCAAYITLAYYSTAARPWVQADPLRLDATRVLNIITMFVILAMLAYYYRWAATEAELALTHANQSLEYQAHTDPLTHLSNRRDMQASLRGGLAAYQSRRPSFSIVLGDIDDFKELNDRYGHEAGDNTLVAVAGLMRTDLREQDLVARWGGEEFLMFLAETPLDKAQRVAERLRERIAAAHIPIGAETVSVTMTLGVAEYAGELDSLACIKRADDAMYRGKRQGKNQVVADINQAIADRQRNE